MSAEPFLRWAGGKRWLTASLTPLIAHVLRGRFFEPFLGSGAVFFGLAPAKAELSDINEDLLNAYRWVRDEPLKLQRIISDWAVNAETYYALRARDDLSGVEAAARFIYLNRTCYGGIHRTNQQGRFNTPYGGGSRTPDVLWRTGILARCSEALDSNISLRCSDFERMIDRAGDGDVIFCDPTYSDFTGKQFDRYGAVIFGWKDQVRLASAVHRAADRGAVSLICNGFAGAIRSLYPHNYHILKTRKKSIGNTRVHGTDDEMVVIVDPMQRMRLWSLLGEIERSPMNSVAAIREAHFPPTPAEASSAGAGSQKILDCSIS